MDIIDAYDAIASWYDLEHGDFTDDLDLYLNYAAATGGPVLEAGCGSGRILVPLAREGYRVTGIDSSQAMLDRCYATLAEEDLLAETTLIQGDMKAFTAGRRDFRLAIITLGTFNHLSTVADRRSVLATLRAHVLPGATLVLDVAQTEPRRFAALAESGQVVHIGSWTDANTGELLTHMAAARPGEHTSTYILTHWYDAHSQGGAVRRTCIETTLAQITRAEVELLLLAAGWRPRQWYGDYELGDWDDASPRLIVMAQAAE
jgi:SAM-dependent methyltransferase